MSIRRITQNSPITYDQVNITDVLLIGQVTTDYKITLPLVKKYILDNKTIAGTAAGSIADITTAQTFTNKTYTSPMINSTSSVSATSEQINKLDGMNATTVLLNRLVGLTVGSAQLNALTNINGNVQSQIDPLRATLLIIHDNGGANYIIFRNTTQNVYNKTLYTSSLVEPEIISPLIISPVLLDPNITSTWSINGVLVTKTAALINTMVTTHQTASLYNKTLYESSMIQPTLLDANLTSTWKIGGTLVISTPVLINKLSGLTPSTTQLNYVSGSTSNLQSQINAITSTLLHIYDILHNFNAEFTDDTSLEKVYTQTEILAALSLTGYVINVQSITAQIYELDGDILTMKYLDVITRKQTVETIVQLSQIEFHGLTSEAKYVVSVNFKLIKL